MPTRWVGPIKLSDGTAVSVPMATYETPLWPSVGRGAAVARHAPEGVRVTVGEARMTRSLLFEAPSAGQAAAYARAIEAADPRVWHEAVAAATAHGKFIGLHIETAGPLLFVRLALDPADASGHNMTTKSADALAAVIARMFPDISYRSVSGNYCTDKKVSAVNGILGRGRHVSAEITVPRDVCLRILGTSAENIVTLNFQKNWVGGVLAGSLRSANAHFANMLLAVYLATGQDAANIIEGSQGTVFAQVRDGDLYFCVTLPNLIMGTVGNGKHLPGIRANLERIGGGTQGLVKATAAAVLCGELSLLAALTVPGKLVEAHMRLERP